MLLRTVINVKEIFSVSFGYPGVSLKLVHLFLLGPIEQLTDYNRIRGGMYWLRL